jgi:hypothetical protein
MTMQTNQWVTQWTKQQVHVWTNSSATKKLWYYENAWQYQMIEEMVREHYFNSMAKVNQLVKANVSNVMNKVE